ncbi:hypothetical protein ABIF63_000293 [Bradyrhizobium japonicum]|uniref:Uncharacterized protein n=1 Tax=Bradyrhizobium japonicum TaxID=375 RepID=A0ABV2RHV8_BRAJP
MDDFQVAGGRVIMAGTTDKYVKAATQIRLLIRSATPKALPKDRSGAIITPTASVTKLKA